MRGALWALTIAGRVLISILVPLIAFAILWQGFLFLRQNDAPEGGHRARSPSSGASAASRSIYWVMNWFLARLPERVGSRILPYLFVGPAIAILIWFLALPTLRTLWISLFNADSTRFVGLGNYIVDLRQTRRCSRSSGTTSCGSSSAPRSSSSFGLVIAVLADRSRFESLAKAIIFMPMAISFVGAGIIWNFIYVYRQAGEPQIGLLNAVVTGLGGQPQAWTTLLQPWNNLFLIVIMVWLQAGFAMVLFSAAIKGIPAELTEAARVDGATERQVFFEIMVPMIRGTIITVSTTIIIFTLKIFDVVIVMTGGQFGTGVIGDPVLPAVLHQPELRHRLGARHHPADRGDPGDDLQPAPFRSQAAFR